MTRLDPLHASENIRSAYLRYLETTFAPADPNLREDLRRELEEPRRLTKGPILQASPPFRSGSSLEDLVHQGVVHPDMTGLDAEVFPLTRPLHSHQEAAIRRVTELKNTIVATGTGSGKTETFMLPILDSLLREREEGTIAQPGVRALLLYPMNALAHDQMKRLRGLFAPFPELTFGQYVGTTKDRPSAALADYRTQYGTDPGPNELISRDAMQERPPHVLLTNFAMLEFLLLRPADSAFFDGPTGNCWRFVVLDEIHVYDGAKGAELAMLLRRVRDRVVQSERGRLTCVGTSATLGSNASATQQLLRFATTLFDESFDDNSIVTPDVLPLQQGKRSWALPLGGAQELLELIGDQADPAAVASFVGAHWKDAPSPTGCSVSSYLHAALSAETTICALQAELERGPVDLSDLAERVLGGAHHQPEVVALVDLGIMARADESSASLIPARYHLLVRSLEGGFLCLSPSHPPGYTRLSLNRFEHCDACHRAHNRSMMFEAGACRRCGATYVVGSLDDQQVLRNAPVFSEPDLFLLVAGSGLDEEDEDELIVDSTDGNDQTSDVRHLCTSCGEVCEQGQLLECSCGDNARREVTVATPTRKGEPLRRCVGCGGRSSRGIVLRYVTGVDAPVAVLASELYQALPPSNDPAMASKVGQGRKLLSFADSRQDAAFFAPFLNRTYGRNVQRHLVLEALKASSDESPRLDDLAPLVIRLAENAMVLDPDDSPANKRTTVRIWLIREALGVDRRQSLAGTGLVDVGVAIPTSIQGAGLPLPIARLGLNEEAGFGLVRTLLGTLVSKAALDLPDGVGFDEPELDPFQRQASIRLHGSDPKAGIASWLPSASTNGRLDFVRRVLDRIEADADPTSLLEGIWTWLTSPGSKWTDVLSHSSGKHGPVHRINTAWLEFRLGSGVHTPFRCDSCAQVWWNDVAGVCPSLRCTGTLASCHPDDRNYFTSLYGSTKPNAMRVQEHTAQLQADRAKEIAQKFIHGDVNTLSCSTTFELGVDVGEVQGVLLRNVPPSPANYVQRAGRAGRRSDSSALVVTFAQRRPHDRYFFDEPWRLIGGQVEPPLVSLSNDTIVRRHLHAVAYAAFVRLEADSGMDWAKSISQWFATETAGSTASDRFIQWLRTRPTSLRDTLVRVCPPEAELTDEIPTWGWVDAMLDDGPTSDKGWYIRAASEATTELDTLHELLQEEYRRGAAGEKVGRSINYLEGVKRTLGQRPLISFLAQRKVLPKYGFPVDVVDLDLSWDASKESKWVELDRDLRQGIVEFAPGNVIVAGDAHWTATGLRKPPNREFLMYDWFECKSCRSFTQRTYLGDSSTLSECDACGCTEATKRGRFVHPVFGFIGEKGGGTPGLARPKKTGWAEIFFGDYASDTAETVSLTQGGRSLVVQASRQGQLSAVNTGEGGRGFNLCTSCGHIEASPAAGRARGRSKKKEHAIPARSGRTCSGGFWHVQLGHYFQTDVVMIESDLHIDSAGATSAVAALVAGVSSLGISRGDVDGITRWIGGKPSFVLFDTVPGGAGHAMHLRDRVPELIEAAKAVSAECECGADTSCYGCLRSFSNQKYHDQLSRKSAIDVLTSIWPSAADQS